MAETSSGVQDDNPSPWSGPRLLVPVTLQALVVTQDFMSVQSNWSILQTNYKNLQAYKTPVDPLPCQTGQLLAPGGQPGAVWTGAVLHWTLPESLRHGSQPSDASPAASPAGDEIVYPPIPNRWLIVRTYQNPNGPPDTPSGRVTKSWVLESDTVSATAQGPSPLPAPNFWMQGTQTPGFLGRSFTLDKWLQNWPAGQQSPPQSAPLTAVGVGDATYPAYVANINNVLSFQDDLSDLPGPFPNTYLPLTYMVFGWYSDTTADPLHGATAGNWEQLLGEYNWTVKAPGVYPNQILCHAMTYGLKWYGPNGPTQSGVPSVTSSPPFVPMVAVGNTSVEALAALIEQQLIQKMGQSPAAAEKVAEIMEAFQYNLIQLWDQPGGQVEVDQRRHQACFGSGPGGTIWEVIAPQPASPSPPSPPSGGDAPPPLTPEQAALLTQLNELQQDLDRQRRLLSSMQWELYAFWWLYSGFSYSQTKTRIQNYLQTLQAAVKAQAGVVNSILHGSGGVEGLETVQALLVESLGDSLQLVSAEAPRFWQPVDPVVLLCGAKGSFKHGPEARLSADGGLPCRVTGQTVLSITVTAGSAPSHATVAAAELNPGLDAPQTTPPIPAALTDLFKDITALFGESMLLDTTEAGMIAKLALTRLSPPDSSVTFKQLVSVIQNQQTCFWNSVVYPSVDEEVAATATGFDGVIPYVIAVTPWSPPWSPLYMDWQVTWMPSYYYVVNPSAPAPAPNNPPGALSGWSYDELDYDWDNTLSPTAQPGYILQGRTLLTPSATDVFVARLKELLGVTAQDADDASSPPDDPTYTYSPPPDVVEALGEVLKIVSQWDILSQNMSGFHFQLIQQDTGQHIQCNDSTVGPLVGGGDHAVPIFDNGTGQRLIGYNPVRAGHFILNQLWIVDDFGQVFNVGQALNNQPSAPFSPTAVSDWLTTPGPPLRPTPVQMPPRVVQPARLSFSFVSAEDDGRQTAYVPGANPVCGWVLPNHLDNSLGVYDAAGLALGEIQLVGGEANKRARWNPVPDSPAPVGAPPDIANAHLRDFVEGILDQPDGGGPALSQLLDVIDETLWTIDPLGARTDQSLSVLIGRPLALARASVAFELAGQPVYDKSLFEMSPAYPNTPNFTNTAGFTNVTFTVKLGSLDIPGDGMLGYFMGDDYARFNSLHTPDAGETSPYVVQNDLKLQLNTDLTSPPAGPDLSSPAGESAAYVTMLMDPRGAVHASTGVLPVQEVTLPSYYVQPALAQMEVTFQTGPLLTATERLQMPLPASNKGDWSWVQHPNVTVWQEIADLQNSNPQAVLSDLPLSVREGWLKLSGALGDDGKAKG
jgi:hypothetical protein